MTFNNIISFKAYFELKFENDFKGQEVKFTLWQSKISNNSLYSNYTFPINYKWDDFYYDMQNHRILNGHYITVGHGKLKVT